MSLRVPHAISVLARIAGLGRLADWFSNQAIGTKIVLVGLIGSIGLALTGGMYLRGVRYQTEAHSKANQATQLSDLMSAINVQFLEARRAEKDFLLRSDEVYSKRHAKVAHRLTGTLDALVRALIDQGHAALAQQAKDLSAANAIYLGHFTTLAKEQIDLGLNENLGLQGALRKSVHAVETIVAASSNSELLASMLTMRRHEKDFMLRKQARYGELMTAAAGRFSDLLSKASIPAEVKSQIDKLLVKYQEDFSAYMAGTSRAALASTTLSDAYSSIEPRLTSLSSDIERLHVDAKAAYESAIAATTWQMVIGTVLIGVLSLTSAIAIGQAIARPLRGMTSAMAALAAGDLDVGVPAQGKRDELGQMAKAVIVFRDAAVDKIRIERDAEAARVSAEEARVRAQEEAITSERLLVTNSIGVGLARLASKDLTYRIEDKLPSAYTKLQSDFNSAIEALEFAMATVKNSSTSIAGSTAELSGSTDSLSKRTEQQAASLEETAAALDEITATGRKAAEGASHARAVVSTAQKDAAETSEVVRRAIGAMGEIETSAQQISTIVGVIDEIAFQTNLLALNAGVEAARAGDSGRGFAVVASEVRALAQRSADAAKEIKALINKSTSEVSQGVVLVGNTGEALKRFIGQVLDINAIVNDIAAGAQEQATGLAEVNTAINQMDQATQQNAAMVEETTAASHALKREAEELDRLMRDFKMSHSTDQRMRTASPNASRIVAPTGRSTVGGSFTQQRALAVKPEPDEWAEF